MSSNITFLTVDPLRIRGADGKSFNSNDKENQRGLSTHAANSSRGGHRGSVGRNSYQHQGGRSGGSR